MDHVATEALVPFADPDAVLQGIVSHIETDHDAQFATDDAGARYIENAGFRIALQSRTGGLHIALSGPNENMLVFFKDGIARHVAEIDPALADNLRWSGETAEQGRLPDAFRILTVAAKSQPMPGMVRVTLKVADAGFFAAEGIHLKMMLPVMAGRAPVWPAMGANGAPVWPQGDDRLHDRFLTIRAQRPETREVDLDVVSHGDGLISSWAMQAQPGDEIGAMGPVDNTRLGAAERYLLAADRTGLPAIARILEKLPNALGDVVGEADSLEALRAYLPDSRFTLHHLPPDRFAGGVTDYASGLAGPGAVGFALFLGEFSSAQSMRKFFRAGLGLGKGEQLSVAYWRDGKAGFDS